MKPIYNWDRATVCDIEEWRDVTEFPGRYEISSFGNMRSKSFLKTGKNVNGEFSFYTKPKPIKLFLNPEGYFQVSLMCNAQRYTRKVHRLVALAFLPNPENKPMVNHINSVRSDNRVGNLEWVTDQENVQHSYDVGENSNSGELHPRSILTEDIVRRAKSLVSSGVSIKDTADMLGFKYATIWSAVRGVNWSNV